MKRWFENWIEAFEDTGLLALVVIPIIALVLLIAYVHAG